MRVSKKKRLLIYFDREAERISAYEQIMLLQSAEDRLAQYTTLEMSYGGVPVTLAPSTYYATHSVTD